MGAPSTSLNRAPEHIPLPDASCDAALLFFVWHHVADREGAARELRRVVKPGGKLFVQANFSDRMPDVWWFNVMPEWRKADKAQFRSEAAVKSDFERLKLRAVSVFEHLSEDVVDAGFAKIEAALPSLGDGPQHETSELLVFQR